MSLGITVYHLLASLVMPNSNPRDGFLDHTLTLMMYSYNLEAQLTHLSLILKTHKSVVLCLRIYLYRGSYMSAHV